ncbi:MAG: GyrI-like domain-containing protein [Anaerolineae bacterium]|nr:GyrI-like domain-containing protein [Anaerolineae bacterium]
MLKIGEFSRLAQVTVKTLRHYEKLALIKPVWIDRYTSYRYYALDQLPRLNRILALKDLGFSLEQIGDILSDDVSAAELRGMLKLKHVELQQQVTEAQGRLTRVEARLMQIEHEGALPEYEIVLRREEQRMVVGIRDTLPDYGQIGRLFGELTACLQRQGVLPPGLYPYIAVYYDDEHQEGEVDVEAAVEIPMQQPPMVESTPRATVHILRGAPTMACTIHHGPFEMLSEAYNALTLWMQANGYRITAPNREIYLQGAGPGIDPADYVVEIQCPVEHVLSTLTLREKEIEMEPKIVTKSAFTLIGMRYFGKNEHGEIPALWDRLNPRWHEFKNQADNWAYGVCTDMNDRGEIEYVAGIAVTDASHVPEGMVVRQVPEAKYAVFETKLSNIGKTYDYAMHTWLPQSGYAWGQSPDFEMYGAEFDPAHPQEGTLYVYVPIK